MRRSQGVEKQWSVRQMGCARVAQPYAVHAKVVHLLSITLHFKCLVDNILGGPRAGGGPDPPFLYYSRMLTLFVSS